MSAADPALRQRAEAKLRFLGSQGWGAARIAPLAGDASPRRYDRLHAPGRGTAVLMDAPADQGENTRPFLAIGEWLCAAGFSAPRTHASDTAAGFVLMEDLGDALFARHCALCPQDEATLYGAAVDVLCALHGLTPPATIAATSGDRSGEYTEDYTVGPYDMDALLEEAALLTDWYLPAASQGDADIDACRALFEDALAELSGARDVLVLRDYHAENLLWLPERIGNARVGLIDYQDALRGHRAYDLVSLLQDARRDTDPALQNAMLERYVATTGQSDAAFRAAYALFGAQRNIKIIGIFARLCRRDGKPDYLQLIPRVWAHLQEDLRHPCLRALSAWVERYVPPPSPGVLRQIAAV